MPKVQNQRRRSVPRKITASSIERAAQYHIARFATSSENLRQVLKRRILRASKYHNTDITASLELVDKLIRHYLERGILDDKCYALTQALKMNRRGKSIKYIRSWLYKKYISKKIINNVLKELFSNNNNPDLIAALSFARKRQFGPYRKKNDGISEIDKEYAAFARSGFSYSLAKQIIEAQNIENLENKLL